MFLPNKLKIISLNLNTTWYKEIQSISQYLIASFLRFQSLLKLEVYSLYSENLILPSKSLKSGTFPI